MIQSLARSINLLDLIGKVLDEKYMIEEPLGQGGMGSVYLATHIGTQRPVAVKVIAPQFMAHTEFVERFRREAEAAGRLRHPNVVNVTDFGFTHVDSRQLAYLVMEYLDGCSLAEVLAEEGKLPLPWAADILEQVCSAIEEAHQCGIIHRDLKPDNIWLEPNRRGGYTIKVLDFGLAKIAEAVEDPAPATTSASISGIPKLLDLADEQFTEADTQVQTANTSNISEEETNILPATSQSKASASLTRVGTILGTPLYMSPEQCLGQPLGIRSDIYSLGVITYQMLGGRTPFSGDGNSLIKKHVEESPPPLKLLDKKIPKQVSDLVMSALAKNPADRPTSAASFASAFRARSEGVIALLRQGVSFYSAHFPTFFKIALISHIPVIVMTVIFAVLTAVLTGVLTALPSKFSIASKALGGVIGLCFMLFGLLIAKVVSQYVFVPATAQLLLAPLREVSIRKIFDQLYKDIKPLIKTSIRVHLYSFIYGIPLIFTGLIAYMNYLFYIPVFIMEGKQGSEAMQRSKQLVGRIRRVVIPLFIISLFLNGSISDSISGIVVTIPSALMSPIISIVFTLAYIRARQTDGETINEILARIAQEDEIPTSKWQQKIRETRITRPTTRQSFNKIGATK